MNKTTNKTGTLEKVETVANLTSKYIRCGELAFAGESLSNFIRHFSKFCEDRKLTSNKDIANMLAIMLKAQERNDMLFVADILQYELIPYLKNINT